MDKVKFASYIFVVMAIAFVGLRLINLATKYGTIKIGDKKFNVEIAKNDWELEKGLSGRRGLKTASGMFFVFPKSDYYGFWMKNMEFPLDIIWINNGKIVDMKKNVPVPTTKLLEKYVAVAPAKYVLEINAGLAERYEFKIGDELELDI